MTRIAADVAEPIDELVGMGPHNEDARIGDRDKMSAGCLYFTEKEVGYKTKAEAENRMNEWRRRCFPCSCSSHGYIKRRGWRGIENK